MRLVAVREPALDDYAVVVFKVIVGNELYIGRLFAEERIARIIIIVELGNISFDTVFVGVDNEVNAFT